MSAKDIILKPIPSKTANDFVKKNHYSGKVVSNSQLHFGVFYKGLLGGVMSYGPSTDKSKLIWLIEGTEWNEFIELNRMAFSDLLPKNSESRAIAISIRLLKQKAPHLKWIISFADGCQCGDGTIYRASGFELTNIKENDRLIKFKDWYITHWLNLCHRWSPLISVKYNPDNLTEKQLHARWDFEYIKGFMLRYIKHLKPNLTRNYEVLQYSKIEEMWASMYKGEKIMRGEHENNALGILSGEGGAIPTTTLHTYNDNTTICEK